MSDILEAAHTYGRRGWRIVPLHHMVADQECSCRLGRNCPAKTRGKHPIHTSWTRNASASGADIQAWWDEFPDANVGITTGAESGIWVLDIDGAAGFDTLTRLADENGSMPRTRVTKTGSGGLHYYWRHPSDFTVIGSTSWIGPGVDIRGKGGQVVAPPSVSGRGSYELLVDAEPADAPGWLLEMVREHAENSQAGRTHKVVASEPVDFSFLPEKVRTLASTLVEEDKGRYKHFYALVAACREAGFAQGQTVTIAEPWCIAVDKFTGRVASEVARAWGKLDAADARAESWMPGITGTSALAPEQPATHAVADIESTEGVELADIVASWAPIDLTSILDGTYVPEEPALFPRADGVRLLYPGRVHSFHGESESGKSLVVQAECARVLADPQGGRVAYLDFESDQGAVVIRLISMGAPIDAIRSRLDYIRPETTPYGLLHEREAWTALLGRSYTIAALDGVTEALVTYGAGSMDNDEITGWMRRVPRLIAQRTGAAVILIDHVSKNSENRGRFAIGAQAKLSALDGAAYSVEVVEALGRGLRGVVSLRIGKDRPGAVRPQAGPFRKSDRTQEAARVVVDSTNPEERIDVTVEAPTRSVKDDPSEFRPTHLMEMVSRYLQRLHPDGAGTNEVKKEVTGEGRIVGIALEKLVDEGYVALKKVGQKHLHVHVKGYSVGCEITDSTGSEPVRDDSEEPVRSPVHIRTGEPVSGRVVVRPVAGKFERVNLDTGEILP